MTFSMPTYLSPDFSQASLVNAPAIKTAQVPADGIAPDNYHATSIFPEYFKIGDQWKLIEETRMDCVVVIRPDGQLNAVEFRNLKKGDTVILGRTEDGSEGIFVHSNCFDSPKYQENVFAFRKGRSRETAFSQDYDTLYSLMMHERLHGNIVWVMGPACTFDSDARAAIKFLFENGFAHGLLAGNALATHDLEAAYFGTALGQDIYSQQPRFNGHYNHIDLINSVKKAGSIEAFVENNDIQSGIMQACVHQHIPYVLTSSIRDDGPLPGVIPSAYDGQDAMRNIIRKATTIICLATQLHTIASCNMTPCYRVVNGEIRPLFIYSVDVTEFAIRKLHDRGSLSATGIITNVQDFSVMLAKGLQKKLTEE